MSRRYIRHNSTGNTFGFDTVGNLTETPSDESAGAAAGGVTVAEKNFGPYHFTKFTFSAVTVALADEAGVIAYGGKKIYDFPDGAIQILSVLTDIDLTKSSAGVNADWDGDFSLGTVTASNNASLTSTEANILPSTATPQAVSGATTANGFSTITEAGLVINGTSTAADMYINFLVDDDDHNVTGTPCNLILNGTARLMWVHLGDY